MHRSLPAVAVALCAGCDIVYPEQSFIGILPDASYVDRRALDRSDVYRAPTDRGSYAGIGQPCEDAGCPSPLVCAPRSCGPERTCVLPVTDCDQREELVCDCDGTTRQNECAARAANVGVAYAGACDGRAPDGGAGDATAADAGVNTCATMAGCDYGEICCAEPRAAGYGRCAPVRCAECCVP